MGRIREAISSLLPVLLMVGLTSQVQETSAVEGPSLCLSGTYMKTSYENEEGHRCVAECGPGLYGEAASRACQPCAPPCLTCTGAPGNCTSCSRPDFLLGNSCVLNCGGQLARGPARSRLRLRGGDSLFEGRVEILHEGVWGTICDDMWGPQDARVVCSELQLGSVVEVPLISDTTFGLNSSSRMPIHLDNVECRGTESQLEFCEHLEWGRHNCGHYEDAAVRCSGPDTSRLCVSACGDGYYRVPGRSECALCSPDCLTCSGHADRCLSCQAPRFLLADRCATNCGAGRHGNTASRACEPCHESCRNCLDGPANDACSTCQDHLFLDGQRCVERTACDPRVSKNLALRLADGETSYEGRVEVYIDGEWGTVCDDGWNINDAEVVCRELGYGTALAALSSRIIGSGTGPIIMSHVQCTGSEAELVHCPQSAWRDNLCGHSEDAGVRCSGPQTQGATGRCLESCGKGYYLPALSDYDCAACTANCLSCEINADQCTSCKPSKFLKGFECVDSCGPSEYGNTATNRCESCDLSRCGSCRDGTRNDNCETCSDEKVLKGTSCARSCAPDAFSQGGVCQPECDHGFSGNAASNICQTCPAHCLTCGFNSEYSIVCTACPAPKLLSDGQCVDECPSTALVMPMEGSALPGGDQIRLVGGRDQLEGRLEIYHDSQWGTVCSDRWTIHAASVACRHLNLGQVESIIQVRTDGEIAPGQGTIWLDNVSCRGSEASLLDCRHNEWGQNNCNHLKDVALRCTGPGIRQCVSTCPEGFYQDGSGPAGRCSPCQRDCLRCAGLPAYACRQCRPGTLLGPDGVSCVDECAGGFHPDADLAQCTPCAPDCATCSGGPDKCTSCKAGLLLQGDSCVATCDGYRLAQTDKVRLADGASPLEGRVEVLYQGEYGTVCDDWWGLEEADVVCAQLGLGRALRATEEASHGEGTGSIVLDNMVCEGDEPSIFACVHGGLGQHNCQHNEDAGVVCSGPVTSNVCIERSACSTSGGYFVDADGLTCRRCSYSCGTCAGSPDNCTSCTGDRYLGQGGRCLEGCPDGFYSDADRVCQPCSESCLDCIGTADHCTSCNPPLYLQTGACVTDCDSNMVVKKGPADIRLVGGSNHFAGRVEVMFDGAWGTVCDDNFDTNDANVVCRQLQMGLAIQAYSDAHFGPGAGSVVLDELTCSGDEESLADCPGNRLGSATVDCQHSEDAGVQCTGPGSALQCLEDCGPGYYASASRECKFCDSTCLQCAGNASVCTACVTPLFLQGSACAATCPPGYFGNIPSRQCQPCGAKCLECFNGDSGDVCRSCRTGFYLEGSTCVPQCHQGSILQGVLPRETDSPDVRLAGGSEREGRVEVHYDGSWGTVCLDDFDMIDGEVVCQQLGLGHVEEVMSSSAYGSVAIDTPIWLDSVDCQGWEFTLTQCSHEGWGLGRCRAGITMANGDAAVRCSDSPASRPPKNICRDVLREPCQRHSCSADVTCVDLDGDRSVCLECPVGQVGNGQECTLVADTPPEFKARPEDREATVDYPASLTCQPLEGSTPTITTQNWFKDGRPLPAEAVASGRVKTWNRGSLYFGYTRREDTGNYTCVIRNTQGSRNATGTLTVQEAPQIVEKRDATVAVGDTAWLVCLVAGLPVSAVTWTRGDQPATGERFTTFPVSGKLRIDRVTLEDEGVYQCFAENKFGSASTLVRLTVQEPPQFTVRPLTVVEVEQGDSVSINCQAKGRPQPRIQWKKDGNDLPRGENRFKVTPTGDLQLKNVERSDMGTYFCIAANPVQTSSLSSDLLVNGPPVFTKTPSNHTLSLGETVVLECRVIGTHSPAVSWRKDGRPVEGDERRAVRADGLQLKSVRLEDGGLYTCIGTNREGSVESSASVTVQVPVYGKQQALGMMWVFVVVIVLLLLVIVAIVGHFLRRRRAQKALFQPTRLNRSPKKTLAGLGVKFTERSNGSYVEIEKQKAKEERDQQSKGIIEDVDLDVV